MGNDPDMDARRYSIGELAELTGVSRRTVHFYVQRRLIDPPLGRGRGRHYDAGHVRQIREVRALQRLGVPLAAMSEGARPGAVASAETPDALGAARPQAPTPGQVFAAASATPVVRVRVADDVTVELGLSSAPITPALVADLAAAVDAVLSRYRKVEQEEEP
jgi:hypothetical protein